MNDFETRLAQCGGCPSDRAGELRGADIKTLQINLLRTCNMACKHCHLACSPKREEQMSPGVLTRVIGIAKRLGDVKIDVTGGAPEMHPQFREFVGELRAADKQVQVRTNLTVLLEPTQEGTMEFMRDHEVALVASLPCYLEENVTKQRGAGVYQKSVDAIKKLNTLGYGAEPPLTLDLVYNPIGPVLPGDQAELEAAYRRELHARFGIVFHQLLTITNVPIGRFQQHLEHDGQAEEYGQLLRRSFNPATVNGLMCRRQLSIDWDGRLYDCDFNLALGWSANHGSPSHIEESDEDAFLKRRIVTGSHCFACTAGRGSSCGGALA